jgi:hypothetical protein
MLPIIAGFILYNRLCTRCNPLHGLSARELLRPLYPTLGILFLANSLHEFNFWFAPFTVATSTAASLCVINRQRKETNPIRLRGPRLLATALFPISITFLLFLPFQMDHIPQALLIALPLCGLITLSYNRLIPRSLTPFTWNYAVPLCAVAAALMLAGLEAVGIAPILEPTTWAEVFQ